MLQVLGGGPAPAGCKRQKVTTSARKDEGGSGDSTAPSDTAAIPLLQAGKHHLSAHPYSPLPTFLNESARCIKDSAWSPASLKPGAANGSVSGLSQGGCHSCCRNAADRQKGPGWAQLAPLSVAGRAFHPLASEARNRQETRNPQQHPCALPCIPACCPASLP